MRLAHRLLVLGGVVALLCGVALAQARREAEPATVVRAQRIELVDERGVTRARLSTEPGGEVVFRLMSADGEIRVKLGASNEGSGLLLANAATEPGVHVLAEGEGATVKLQAAERTRVIEP